MKFLFISITLILQSLHIQGQNKFATCKREWSKIGCFKDKIYPSRPLPELLLNDRDIYSNSHQPGYRLDWNKWNQSKHSLACRCAQKALQKGYRVFGLQFYGECWSGPLGQFNYSRDGASDNCIMNLHDPTACVKDEPKECVGRGFTNYIYMVTENCDKKMNMVILLDKSGSIKKQNFQKMKNFTKKLAEVMPISFNGTHVAVVSFTHNVKVEWNFRTNEAQNLAAFRKAVDGILYKEEGGTRTDLALKKAYETFTSVDVERRDILQVVLVITDGKTEEGSEPYPKVLKPFKDKGIESIAVGIGQSVDYAELEAIAMNKTENVVQLKKFDDLNNRINDIVAKYCMAT
ncbi:matrilin-4-like [Montipora foliosa]|uniref:matrilin-4-like n=1 Tax=Montipora foliosa TaxID=591990 RepID=UPI0035F2002E